MNPTRKWLAGWGGHPIVLAEQRESEELEAASAGASLSRGLGRSYGDASLPVEGHGPALCTQRADRILAFDPNTGVLRAEAGLSLRALNELFPARGWASPVSPGTQYVTLGGMVASDVHGKNHHIAGCFGEHVRALRLRVGDGRVLEIDDASEPELFRATLGGMGLTGHLLEVVVQLERIPSFWIWRRSERVRDLDELLAALAAASARLPFAAAWFDTTARGGSRGRGLVSSGRYAEPHEAPSAPPRLYERIAVPFYLPGWVIGGWSIRAFNLLWYHSHQPRAYEGVVHPQPFLYPLDAVRHWNRLYGRRGMVQYQCVVPGRDGSILPELIEVVARMGGASPVAVIKDCGAQGRGMISFPMSGMSLALDLPYRPGHTKAVVDALNELVIAAGGRIYLAKDALTSREDFAAMEPRLARWNDVRRKWDPAHTITSALAQRLLDPAA